MDGVSKPGTKLHGHGKASYFLGRQKVSKKLVAQRVIKGGLNGYFYNSPCGLKQIKILFRLNRLLKTTQRATFTTNDDEKIKMVMLEGLAARRVFTIYRISCAVGNY